MADPGKSYFQSFCYRWSYVILALCFLCALLGLGWLLWPSDQSPKVVALDGTAGSLIGNTQQEISTPQPPSAHVGTIYSPDPLNPIVINDPFDQAGTWNVAFNPSHFGNDNLNANDPFDGQILSKPAAPVAPELAQAKMLEDSRQYITCICTDQAGHVWVGTEGNGVQRFDPSAAQWQQWQQFTSKDGLGDNNCYAIECDRRGRIWAGNLNHGVSVFNGQKWQNYDIIGGLHSPDSLSGPLGDRIFSIRVCPSDGDVWMATSAGLTRYSESKDTWTDYIFGDNLPFHEVKSIAFDNAGNLYVGTAYEGIAIAKAQDGYESWHVTAGSDSLSATPTGDGLPTSEINDILVASDGTVYAATVAGIAWSTDQGQKWSFSRGHDWANKIRNSARASTDWQNWKEPPGAIFAQDYATCLAEDPAGTLYVGYRQQGWESFNHADPTRLRRMSGGLDNEGYVNGFAFLPDSHVVAGTYSGGVVLLGNTNEKIKESVTDINTPPLSPPRMPSAASPTDLAALNGLLMTMGKVPPLSKTVAPLVFPMDQDWRTQGAWIGRYGRYFALLGAILPKAAKFDYIWGAGPDPVAHFIQLGTHKRQDEYLRYWLAAPFSDDTRSLETPPLYFDSLIKHGAISMEMNRRQAEWDDHGETYGLEYEGPDLYVSLNIPAGQFILSFYEINDDGHKDSAWNRYRDFEFVIKARANEDIQDISDFNTQPALAVSRCANFYNGVYERFLVQGPCCLSIKVNRQYSLNSILNAVMLDLLDEHPMPYFISTDDWRKSLAQRNQRNKSQLAEWNLRPNTRDKDFGPENTEIAAAAKLMDKLTEIQDWNPQWWAINERRVATEVARWCQHLNIDKSSRYLNELQGTSLYYAGIFDQWEGCQKAIGQLTARDIEKGLTWDGQHDDPVEYNIVNEYLSKLKIK